MLLIAATVFGALALGLGNVTLARAAGRVVVEVRDQFHQPGIMEGTRLPDYARVVDICTRDALREPAASGVSDRRYSFVQAMKLA